MGGGGTAWRINSHGGRGAGSNSLLLPQGPRALISGPASQAPGCLGLFPNKYARASSLSGKHGLPSPHPTTRIPASSARWELGGADVWPRSQDTLAQIPHGRRRALAHRWPHCAGFIRTPGTPGRPISLPWGPETAMRPGQLHQQRPAGRPGRPAAPASPGLCPPPSHAAQPPGLRSSELARNAGAQALPKPSTETHHLTASAPGQACERLREIGSLSTENLRSGKHRRTGPHRPRKRTPSAPTHFRPPRILS